MLNLFDMHTAHTVQILWCNEPIDIFSHDTENRIHTGVKCSSIKLLNLNFVQLLTCLFVYICKTRLALHYFIWLFESAIKLILWRLCVLQLEVFQHIHDSFDFFSLPNFIIGFFFVENVQAHRMTAILFEWRLFAHTKCEDDCNFLGNKYNNKCVTRGFCAFLLLSHTAMRSFTVKVLPFWLHA